MIRAVDLRFRRGARVVIEDVSVNLAPREVLAIVGANGAGKSTLLSLLAGDLTPWRGRVTLAGRDLCRLDVRERARLRAVLPQTPSLRFALTVRQVVTLGWLPYADAGTIGEEARAVERAMERARVAALADRLYTHLSGGERQRVQLARVLAQMDSGAPGVQRSLFLDEPTAGLDAAHQHHTLTAARAEAARGSAVVAVLHDLNLAAQYADRVLLMRAGSTVALGPPADVLTPATIGAAFGVAARLLPHPEHDRPVIVVDAARDDAFHPFPSLTN